MNSSTRVLVTGASGLAGFWLRQFLRDAGFKRVFCLDTIRQKADPFWFEGSVCDREFVERVLRQTQPEVIFHFAGILGNADAEKLIEVNVGGTKALFESLVSLEFLATRVLVTSSSSVYGDKGKAPVREDMTLEGRSNYAVSKLKQEETAFGFHSKYGIPVVVTRGFNNIAPGERESMFISKIAIQIARIEAGLEGELEIGPLFSFRDYLDTRDLVEAYSLLAERGSAGEIYNVCSQEAIKIEELFDILVGNAKVPIDYRIVEYDQSGNIPFQVGSNEKLALTGWKKKRDIRETVIEILEYWRQKISNTSV